MFNLIRKTLVFLGFLSVITYALQAQNKTFSQVANNNCGEPNEQPFLIKGNNYEMPETLPGSASEKSCNFGGTVIYAFDELDIQADYMMEVTYLADALREQRVVADGNEVQAPFLLEKGKVQRYQIPLPKKAYAYGQLVLIFEVVKGANAVISELAIYSSNPTSLKPFEGERKRGLANAQSYTVDTTVCVETVLPQYTPIPHQTNGVYNAQLSLNGTWLFNEKPNAGFEKQKNTTANWKPIIVPGQWSMQGFSVDSAAFAGYKTSFTLPTDWKNNRIKLRFDGVSSECLVYLNGKEVGTHEGGMTPFELDITTAITTGQNDLSLKVKSESTADMLGSLTQYAAHQLGGITRKVTLFAVPEVYLSDLRVQTDFDDLFEDAELAVYATISNASDKKQQNVSVNLSLEGLPFVVNQQISEIPAGSSWSGWLKGMVKKPLKWDNEHPNLYVMNMEVSSNGKRLEQVQRKIGFREVFVDGNQLLVNGIPVKLRGVCRHEMHPLTGRVLNEAWTRKDVELYRDANCNFIRTSHYPPCEELLTICDELGMFVEVEAPVCWIGHHANENWRTLNYRDSIYYPYVLQANMEMIQFYRNYPSVLFWSMANESYWNKEFAQVQVYMEKADPTRPFTFHDQGYGGFNNQGSTAPISNIHYPGPDGYKVAAKSDRPMIYGEYCHLNVYNRSELVTDPGVRSDWALALAPTWENMYKTTGVLGGSIWSGIDDIFQLPNGDAVGYGPWGPIDGWRRPKPEYWDMKKIYSPIRIATSQLEAGNRLELDIENRYTFTNLNETQIAWQFGDEKGTSFIDLNPGKTGRLIVSVKDPKQANELYLSIRDPRGFLVDEFLIPVGAQTQNELIDLQPLKTNLKEKKESFLLTGANFTCEISKSTGQIISMKKQGVKVISGGPWLMALPLTGGGCYPNHNANTPLFNELCSDWKVNTVTAHKEQESVIVKVSGSYNEFKGDYTMCINANGEMTVSYSFEALQSVNPRQWGLVFEAPIAFDHTFWRRDGLWSVYPTDHISRPVGEAKLFYEGLPEQLDPRTEPVWSWSYDFNELGSNDFRSTRRNIWYAGLKNNAQNQITIRSNGKQHWRSWKKDDKIHFLIADFVTAGNEMFLESYYSSLRNPIKTGDKIEASIILRIE